ncbi:uncharacterized protein LOC119452753 [Dermacentor silvarum]|uniref:uncharacterized protein LOC119452753 n=1 Tax=Dermacentor silvarum TaxID=543639 RepID=UPI002101CEB1|nr:uncharacterized protein LOC119452753 [Dermacentor silvarum]
MLVEILTKAIPNDIVVEHYKRQSLLQKPDEIQSSETELRQLLDFLRLEVEAREKSGHQDSCVRDTHDGRRDRKTCATPTASVLHNESSKTKEVGISLLIGADQMWKLVLNDVWSHDEVTGLAAINTKLGWTFQGPVPCDGRIFKEVRAHVCVLRTSCTETDVSETLQHFWELDSIGISDPSTHDEHGNEVVRQFTENIAFKNGRYEVALPWKSVNTYLADNRSVAVRRLHGLLRRFGSNEELLQQYDKAVRQYELDDHAERVNGKDSAERCYYMPHHAVIRESSSTTRLRVVFDASSHAHGAASLNELLEKGPKINNNMVKMLVNFRLHKIGITADVQKAFLQIGIQEPDRDALRFLWFDSTPMSSEHVPKIVEYRMTRVPFGTTASPFLLTATLQYHFKHINPALRSSAMQLAENFYVDDLVTGVSSSKEAFRLYNEANLILSKAGMKLQKWSTNDDELRKYITDRLDSVSAMAPTKVLGLLWDTAADKLILNMESLLQILEKKNDTKRCVLQTTARIFDPLGWLSPFVVRMKVLFQRLWEHGTAWEEVMPEQLRHEWETWSDELKCYPVFSLPRCELKLFLDKPSSSQLHVFADASSVAYGAVAYLRMEDQCGNVDVQLLFSKCRVAPIKRITLPRLELIAAVLASRVLKFLREALESRQWKIEEHLWTDSSVALCWIQSTATKWKQFVYNRVNEIRQVTDPDQWHHCPGTQNPADLLTRGLSLTNLRNSQLWWKGPNWLLRAANSWPTTSDAPDSGPEDEQVSSELQTNVPVLVSVIREPLFSAERFSSWLRMARVTAWVKRFVDNCRSPTSHTEGSLTATEVQEAENIWFKQMQTDTYAKERAQLEVGQDLDKTSSIRDLHPFIDEKGVMRIRTRLQNAEVTYNEKTPVLLPSNHPVTRLVILQAHKTVLHGGVGDTLNELRARFWVPRVRQAVKRVLRKCVICAPVRAIHLEHVVGLTTNAFLMAFKRFCARRGTPRIVYSDNATTFKKAARELASMHQLLRKEEVSQYCSTHGITWKFIAERAPWWGGFWERLVRIVKMCLRKSLGRAC